MPRAIVRDNRARWPAIGTVAARSYSAALRTLQCHRIQLAVGSQPLRLRNHNFGLTHRIMVKLLATSPHDPLSITDSACKNQSDMVSVQYGPFNTYIPIRSTTIGKSRVARDPITMHTSRRSNSDIACVTSIEYPRIKASGESLTTKHRLIHASEPHPIPPPNDPNRVGKRVKVRQLSCRISMTFRVVRTNQYNPDLGLIHSTNGNHLESSNEDSSIDHQVTIHLHAQNITMFHTNETRYFTSQMLVSSSGGLILILTAQSTRNEFEYTSTGCVLGKWVYLVTLVMSLFDVQDVCIVIGSLATLDLPMVVDLIGIYVLKGPYSSILHTRPPLLSLNHTPPAAALWRHLRDRTCFDHHDEEFPSMLNSSVLLVLIDGGILIPVVDLIRRIYRRLQFKSQNSLRILVGARCLDASKHAAAATTRRARDTIVRWPRDGQLLVARWPGDCCMLAGRGQRPRARCCAVVGLTCATVGARCCEEAPRLARRRAAMRSTLCWRRPPPDVSPVALRLLFSSRTRDVFSVLRFRSSDVNVDI
ncbi:hypothetical protein F511_23115 [Dorcoceras hygrometricum]|uniref:Uncharacterized protein n=1 Tax=Dorcoceras hygrometricum TaxID=472368 RepID=A0A2Z7ACJ5_9LAMI|nr:hypothetical protein F511_23115 [Dorcoceras hygrometricum]